MNFKKIKYTIDEAAKYLNVSTAYIYRLIHTAKLKCIDGYINKKNLEKYRINYGIRNL